MPLLVNVDDPGTQGVTDEALKEAQHINKSLSALTTCILALHKKDAHVPFRDSKLTHILQARHMHILHLMRFRLSETGMNKSVLLVCRRLTVPL